MVKIAPVSAFSQAFLTAQVILGRLLSRCRVRDMNAGPYLMRSLRIVGLACATLLAGVAATAAQSETESAPPIRLPGIVYPKPADVGVRATTPKLKPKAQSDRAPAAPETTQGVAVAPEDKLTSTPAPGEHSRDVTLPGVAYPGGSATRAAAPKLVPKDRSTRPLEAPAAREPPSSTPMVPPEIPAAPETSYGLLTAPGAKEQGTPAPRDDNAAAGGSALAISPPPETKERNQTPASPRAVTAARGSKWMGSHEIRRTD
jgi:hypothetical protein